jgi:hypothetical protein
MQITCLTCGAKGRIPDEKVKLGMRVRCPRCQGSIEIVAAYNQARDNNAKGDKEEAKPSPPSRSPALAESTTPFKMGMLSLISNWVIGILFALMAFSLLFQVPKSSVPLFLISLLLLPPIRKRCFEKTRVTMAPKVRAGLIVVLCFIAFWLANTTLGEREQLLAQEKTLQAKEQERLAAEKREAIKQQNIQFFEISKSQIMDDLNKAFANGQYQMVLTQSEKYIETNDAELIDVRNRASEQILLLALKNASPTDYATNKKLYQDLLKLRPTNSTYKKQYAAFTAHMEEQQKQERYARERKNKIENQFSAWNGSHIGLERIIMASMNDPRSYKHVETRYGLQQDHLLVTTTFRGTNAFGGVVTNSLTAKFDLDGNLLAILK